MKIILLTCLLFTFGCTKEIDRATIDPALLKGTWELRYSSFDTNPTQEYTPGTGPLLDLDGTRFKLYTRDTVLAKGTYAYLGLKSNNSSGCVNGGLPSATMDCMEWSPGQSTLPRFFALDNDTLFMYSGCIVSTATAESRWEKVR